MATDRPTPPRRVASPPRRFWRRRGGARSAAAALLVGVLPALLLAGCREREASPDASAAAPAGVATAGGSRPAALPSPDWVRIHDPARAWQGYTLTLHEARAPVLLDMNGRVVHGWPQARLRSRVRLLPDGSILGIDLGRLIVEHDWEGRQTLALRTPGAIPHHDVIRLRNGNVLALVLRDGAATDTLLELDRAGAVVWSWEARERLGDLLPKRPPRPRDVTHFNSVQELPENPWHAAGDERFRPGNLLVSARNLHTIFVIDRESGDVVWSFRKGLDMQHEALMTAPGLPGAGLVQLFNNRRASFRSDRQSEILELDPRTGAVAWRFRMPGFYSPTGGSQQALPNGNVLVTSTRGGRVFEVTREGRIVWEWVPAGYEPVRALRVAADACPQLAALPPQRATAVEPPAGYRHVDPDAYRFARRGSRRDLRVEGTRRTVLAAASDCRDLLLPMDAHVRLAWGVDRSALRSAAGDALAAPGFVARLHPAEGPAVELLRDAIGADGPAWRERTLPLTRWAGQPVRLCVEIDGGTAPGDGARYAWWEQPLVGSGEALAHAAGEDDDETRPDADDDLSPEERDVRRRHLETLGYVG